MTMTQCTSPATGPPQRTLEDIHRDVAFANSYRLELIKHTISLSAGVFVLTLTFIKDYIANRTVLFTEMIPIGWAALVVSILGGLAHMATWDRYYISYRDWDFAGDKEKGKKARKLINICRWISMVLQFGGLAAGLVAMLVFYAMNL
jgi:hypothetical protein